MKLRPEEVWLCAVLQLCSAIIFHELVRAKCQQKMKEQETHSVLLYKVNKSKSGVLILKSKALDIKNTVVALSNYYL